MPSCASVSISGEAQGIGFRQQALMHGVGTEALVDQSRPHDFRRHAGVDFVVRKTPRGIFREQQLSNMALRVGQRRRDRVPAIKNDRTVRARFAVAPGRSAAGFAPLFGGFAAAAPEVLLSIAIAHGRLVSWVPNNGNLSPSWRLLAAGVG